MQYLMLNRMRLKRKKEKSLQTQIIERRNKHKKVELPVNERGELTE
jgi:hypothetical protein